MRFQGYLLYSFEFSFWSSSGNTRISLYCTVSSFFLFPLSKPHFEHGAEVSHFQAARYNPIPLTLFLYTFPLTTKSYYYLCFKYACQDRLNLEVHNPLSIFIIIFLICGDFFGLDSYGLIGSILSFLLLPSVTHPLRCWMDSLLKQKTKDQQFHPISPQNPSQIRSWKKPDIKGSQKVQRE